jgi:hypothetical protein
MQNSDDVKCALGLKSSSPAKESKTPRYEYVAWKIASEMSQLVSTSKLNTLDSIRAGKTRAAYMSLRHLSHRSRHEADAKSEGCDPLELHAAESKRTRRHRRSSTRRRESLCVGMLVLKIMNIWASRDFVSVHRLPLAEI